MPARDIRALVTLLRTELDRPELALDVRRAASTAAWRLRALLSGKPELAAQAPGFRLKIWTDCARTSPDGRGRCPATQTAWNGGRRSQNMKG